MSELREKPLHTLAIAGALILASIAGWMSFTSSVESRVEQVAKRGSQAPEQLLPAGEAKGQADATPEVATAAAPTPAAVPAQRQVAALPPHYVPEANLPANPGEQATEAAVAPAPQPEPKPAIERAVLTVKPGDTLIGLLSGAGIDSREAYLAVNAMKDVFSPRRLRPGHEITVETEKPEDEAAKARLVSLSLRPEVDHDVVVRRETDDAFTASAIDRVLARESAYVAATIDTSLFEAAGRAGAPIEMMIEVMRAYSFDVDFQRDVQPGDRIEVLYDHFRDEDGEVVKTGDLLFAKFVLSGKEHPIYRFVGKNGDVDYYDPNGKSVRRQLLRTPVDGARLSSGYGKRRHPVLGYTKMHKGVDFAASRGTPIYAAGNGTVERANRYGGYGNYIRIRHNGAYSTAYAHLNGFARGIRAGARVKQGQVIGYVGSTGRSTGPHLHYEVLVDGKHVNPRSIKLPAGRTLKREELAAFKQERDAIDAVRAQRIGTPTQLADSQ